MKKLHSDEIEITKAIVQDLLCSQYKNVNDVDLKLLTQQGTDNIMFILGVDKIIRLPRKKSAINSLLLEAEWLPILARQLPISVPKVIFQGKPSPRYAFPWLICCLVPGEHIKLDELDMNGVAEDLSGFINAMHKINIDNAPQSVRGLPLISRDAETRQAISLLTGIYDSSQLLTYWEKFLELPQWQDKPVWLHGDLHIGNLLQQDSRISAIVDFGLAGVGDPACDLMAAWTILSPKARQKFKVLVQADSATWERAKGWAFTVGVVAYPYYKNTHPEFASIAKAAIDAVLSDPD